MSLVMMDWLMPPRDDRPAVMTGVIAAAVIAEVKTEVGSVCSYNGCIGRFVQIQFVCSNGHIKDKTIHSYS